MQKHSMRSFKSGIHAGKSILIACFLLVALRDGIGASPRRTSSQAVIILVAEDCSFSTAVHSLPVDDTKSVSTSIWIFENSKICMRCKTRLQFSTSERCRTRLCAFQAEWPDVRTSRPRWLRPVGFSQFPGALARAQAMSFWATSRKCVYDPCPRARTQSWVEAVKPPRWTLLTQQGV